MAIKVNNVTVIGDTRQLSNVASIDSVTKTTILEGIQADLDVAVADAVASGIAPIEGRVEGLEQFESDVSSQSGSSFVGFRQDGIGAVVRTAQDKMREWVSVKDFGAVGDGVTNDDAAFALAEAAADVLYVPDGTFVITYVPTKRFYGEGGISVNGAVFPVARIGQEVGFGLNTYVGTQAGDGATGQFNTVVGAGSGRNDMSGSDNVLIGHNIASGDTVTPAENAPFTGDNNVAVGYQALKKIQSGSSNIAIGRDAANEIKTGSDNVCIGRAAGQQLIADNDNVMIGTAAGGRSNAAALNVAVGRDAARELRDGDRNTMIGWGAGRGVTPTPAAYVGDGSTTTFAAGAPLSSVRDVAVSLDGAPQLVATYTVSGSNVIFNTAPGVGVAIVLTLTIGSAAYDGNTSVGARSMFKVTTGSNNVAMGRGAAENLSSGSNNVVLGYEAGYSNEAGSGNIILGFQAYRGVTSGDNKFVVANQSSVPFLDGTMAGPLDTNNILTVDALTRPSADNTRLLGTSSRRWADVYGNRIRPGTGTAIWTSGAGTPEGAVTAPVGSLYTRTDGGAGTTLYIKETGTGNTGWVAK